MHSWTQCFPLAATTQNKPGSSTDGEVCEADSQRKTARQMKEGEGEAVWCSIKDYQCPS